jgi:RHS repeat-associated protein
MLVLWKQPLRLPGALARAVRFAVSLLFVFVLPLAQAQTCSPYLAKVVTGYILLGTGTGATPLSAAQNAIAAMNASPTFYGPVTSGPCAGSVKTEWRNVRMVQEQPPLAAADQWRSTDRDINGNASNTCRMTMVETDYIEIEVKPCPMVITLSGQSHTKALPAGPALPQVATVMQGGAPVPNVQVGIGVAGGGSTSSLSGVTNGSGAFEFTYIPPKQIPAEVTMTAGCQQCSNTASKQIKVDACDICSRGLGNPIQPATGEKQQRESDFSDGSPHGLSFTRVYRSFGNVPAGMGVGWSHNWMANLLVEGDTATVRLGDGPTQQFVRIGEATWAPSSGVDQLLETAQGRVYYRASDESRWLFDVTGKPVAITQRNGWVATLGYANGLSVPSTITNAFGRTLQLAYDAARRLASVTAPDGSSTSYVYDSLGRLIQVVNADGTRRGYLYETGNLLTGIVAEEGMRLATFGYDALGRAVSTTHANGAQSFGMTYPSTSPAGTLVPGSVVDPSTYRLDVQANDPLGTRRGYAWSGGDGRVHPLGASGPFDGESAASREIAGGLPVSEVDFKGVQTLFAWDAGRELQVGVKRAAGQGDEQIALTQWHPTLRLPVLITEAGRTTAYGYDNLGNRLSETITDTATAEARTRSWTYNPQNLVDTMTDARGGVWRYGYDSAGNRTSMRDPLGRTTTYAFEVAGRVVTQTDPGGLVTSYVYDARGRLLSQSVGGETTSYRYTATGQLASVSMPDGQQITYGYDAAQRLVSLNDNRGASITYTLDAMGNRVREEVRDAQGTLALVTGRAVNAINRVSQMQGAQGQTTRLDYDANGEQVAVTDPLNQSTRESLDALRRVTSTTFADNASAAQSWNGLDQLTQVIDPKGVATQYAVNAFGDVMRESSADIGSITYTRDAQGEVSSTTDAKGNVATITRDALGRAIRINYADQTHRFDYDAAGAVLQMQDASGSTTFTRDALGRITSKTQLLNDNPSNPSAYRFDYEYAAGRLASISYPSGAKVMYRRTAGRITAIDLQQPAKGGKASPAIALVSSLTHTALGAPKSWTWFNGDTANRTFDADGRMTSSEIASYSYDAAGRITGITQNLWAIDTAGKKTVPYVLPITWTAGYDMRNRLTSFARPGASSTFAYDPNSNRLTSVETATSEADLDAAFDGVGLASSTSQTSRLDPASNRLLGFSQTVMTTANGVPASTATSNVSYSVDANGSMTSDGLRTFVYDASNRISKVEVLQDGTTASIAYWHNALGQRVFKSDPRAEELPAGEKDVTSSFTKWLESTFGWLWPKGNAKSTLGMTFVYGDGEIPGWALLGEYNNGSPQAGPTTEYVWLPTEDGQAIPVGMLRNGQLYAMHPDHLGTPRLITDSGKLPVWQWPYSAFGNNKAVDILRAAQSSGMPTSTKAPPATMVMNIGMPGQYRDVESGLVQNWYRQYKATWGRYVQSDPIGLAGGINTFAYSNLDPLRYTDPTGLVVGVDDLIFGGGVLMVGCAMNASCSAAATEATTTLIKKAVEACTGDPCQQIYEEIDRLVNQLQRRYRQLREDKGDLPMTGLGSIEGHRGKYRDRQSELRDKLNEANSRGCLGYRQDAWAWATGKPPYPPGKQP